MKTKSATAGANAERTAILAHLRREIRKHGPSLDGSVLISWLLRRNERYQKRKGGLGR